VIGSSAAPTTAPREEYVWPSVTDPLATST
jgi:hypothetical protein